MENNQELIMVDDNTITLLRIQNQIDEIQMDFQKHKQMVGLHTQVI